MVSNMLLILSIVFWVCIFAHEHFSKEYQDDT